MKKFLASILLGAALTACGVEGVVKDITDTAKEAAFQTKAQSVFEAAVTEVTEVTLDKVRKAIGSQTPGGKEEVITEREVEVRLSEELKSGGLVTLTGMVAVTTTVNKTTADALAGVSINTKLTSVRVKVKSEDGSVESLSINGAHRVLGTVQSTKFASASSAPTFDMQWNLEGEFVLDERTVPYALAVTHDGGDFLMYSGTLNGNDVNGTVNMGKEKPPENVLAGACDDNYGKYCLEFYGANFSPWSDSTCKLSETPLAACDTSPFSAKCTYSPGSPDEKVEYTNKTDLEMGCHVGGGVYESL